MELIYTKCQTLFTGKNKQIYFKMLLAEKFTQESLLSNNPCPAE